MGRWIFYFYFEIFTFEILSTRKYMILQILFWIKGIIQNKNFFILIFEKCWSWEKLINNLSIQKLILFNILGNIRVRRSCHDYLGKFVIIDCFW